MSITSVAWPKKKPLAVNQHSSTKTRCGTRRENRMGPINFTRNSLVGAATVDHVEGGCIPLPSLDSGGCKLHDESRKIHDRWNSRIATSDQASTIHNGAALVDRMCRSTANRRFPRWAIVCQSRPNIHHSLPTIVTCPLPALRNF